MLHSLVCYKRINREIDKYTDNIHNVMGRDYCIYLYLHDEITKNQSLILKISKNTSFNSSIIKLQVPTSYPFYPLKVLKMNIDNNIITNYSYYLSNISKILRKYQHYEFLYNYVIIYTKIKPKLLNSALDKDLCMCCASVSCLNNWTPSKTFYSVIEEYIEINAITQFIKLDLQYLWSNTRLSTLNSDVLKFIIDKTLET